MPHKYRSSSPLPGLAFGEPDGQAPAGIQYAAASRFLFAVSEMLNRPLTRAMAIAGVDAETAHVTQRPGCNRFATSVSTLTMGSQATAALRPPDRNSEGAVPLRASVSGFFTTGTRTSTEVSEMLSSRNAIAEISDQELEQSASGIV